MVADVDRFFAKAPAELRNTSNRRVVECPKHVFVNGLWPLLYSYLNEIR